MRHSEDSQLVSSQQVNQRELESVTFKTRHLKIIKEIWRECEGRQSRTCERSSGSVPLEAEDAATERVGEGVQGGDCSNDGQGRDAVVAGLGDHDADTTGLEASRRLEQTRAR